MYISHISVFLIGACNACYYIGLGLVLAMLINSLIAGLFGAYSQWTLVVLSIIFCLVLGYMTYKNSDEIIIVSTSVTGAYLMVRPISWIFGGFPNELLLAQLVQNKMISQIPPVFFLYFYFIVLLASIGGIYQFL
jgi:hypothetical protein